MSVSGPQGFRAAGVAAGIKSNGRPDLALVVNDGPRFAAAGVFTRNKVKAAPVLWSQQVLADGSVDYPGGPGSIHRAGAAVQDAPSCNGWMFWHVEEAGALVPLDSLRQKYILTMDS